MSNEKSKAKRERGVVVSDKMDKTVTVAITNVKKHPRYGKYLERASKFMAHDPHNEARAGDLVEIEATRPLSRRKRWRVVRILRRGSELEQTSYLEEAPRAPTSGSEEVNV